MTRCILVVTFTAASLLTQQASAWEALDNFLDDLTSFATPDMGPPIDYGRPPAVYVPAPAPIVMPATPAYAAPPCCPPPACPPPKDCCAEIKVCWQKTCDWWTSLCANCCPSSVPAPSPYYQPPYVTAPMGTAAMMYEEQPYSVSYPPQEGYEIYSEGPTFEYGPAIEFGPSTGATSEVIPTPMDSI